MKKLLATSALAMIAMTGAASAQSVLERVLGQIDNASNLGSVNGTFANIAENIGGASVVNVYTDGTTVYSEAEYEDALAASNAAAQAAYDGVIGTAPTAPDETDPAYDPATGDPAQYAIDLADYNIALTAYNLTVTAAESARDAITGAFASAWTQDTVEMPGLLGVDGSINTTVVGVSEAVAAATQFAQAGEGVTAYEFNLPTIDIGDLTTTALGAVNTGDITLGVNSNVDEAKTSATQAVSSVMTQLGGSDGSGALVLNIASNMTGVNGSITTVMSDVNGAINSAATTALGAVNTGTIVSGVNAAVQGIVGVSGQ
jgi:hypothetical protein